MKLDVFDIKTLYRELTSGEEHHPLLVPIFATVRWSMVFYKQLYRDRAFVRAGAMAYATLIALVPVLLLVFAILGASGSLGLSIEDKAEVEKLLLDTFLADIPTVREFLVEGLHGLPVATLGLVGLAGLLFVAARLFLMVERAYNDVYGVPINRAMGYRLLNFYFAITAVPVLASLALIGMTQAVGRSATGNNFLEFTFAFALLFVALKGFPCTKVNYRPALIGSFISTSLLAVGRYGFGSYVQIFKSDDPAQTMYGAVGLLPVFLVWLYTVWLFVLLGVEIAYVLQNYTSLWQAEKDQLELDAILLSSPSAAQAVEGMAWVAWSFEGGHGAISVGSLAHLCGIDGRTMDAVMRVMSEAGYVDETKDGWTMRRPASSVSLSDVARRWTELTSPRRAAEAEASHHIGEELMTMVDRYFVGSLEDGIKRWVLPVVEAREAPVDVQRGRSVG